LLSASSAAEGDGFNFFALAFLSLFLSLLSFFAGEVSKTVFDRRLRFLLSLLRAGVATDLTSIKVFLAITALMGGRLGALA
jgi:hypothetical protein